MLFCMDESEFQRPEGLLIETTRAAIRPKLSGNKAAVLISLSPTRWHQIIKGYISSGGVLVPVRGPDDTVADMARIVGVTPDQLRRAGREGAADVLEVLNAKPLDAAPDPVDVLIDIRDQLTALINDMGRKPAP